MNERKLPPLHALCQTHAFVALLWDERLDRRALLGLGCKRSLVVDEARPEAWEAWNTFVQQSHTRASWSFGWLGYDLHACLENMDASFQELPNLVEHPGRAPLLVWWEPEVVMEWKPGQRQAEILEGSSIPWAQKALQEINEAVGRNSPEIEGPKRKEVRTEPLVPQWTQEEYNSKFQAVQNALQRGDIYEMNLCMPWLGHAPHSSSWDLFQKLAASTRAPHSAYLQCGPHRVLCASPERFLAKQGCKLTSQPIKGTIRRGASKEEDDRLKDELASSEKERAENVMIVDLVRNDLSRVAAPNSVEVEELFGIHTFATVHQMISTVSCLLREDVTPLDVFKATFPMGSMTGAPKESAMKHIALQEGQGRGIYSGTLGYIDPDNNWDFNVIIRSLIHCADTGRVDATVGGAITLLADATSEYEECFLKAEALRQSLET